MSGCPLPFFPFSFFPFFLAVPAQKMCPHLAWRKSDFVWRHYDGRLLVHTAQFIECLAQRVTFAESFCFLAESALAFYVLFATNHPCNVCHGIGRYTSPRSVFSVLLPRPSVCIKS